MGSASFHRWQGGGHVQGNSIHDFWRAMHIFHSQSKHQIKKIITYRPEPNWYTFALNLFSSLANRFVSFASFLCKPCGGYRIVFSDEKQCHTKRTFISWIISWYQGRMDFGCYQFNFDVSVQLFKVMIIIWVHASGRELRAICCTQYLFQITSFQPQKSTGSERERSGGGVGYVYWLGLM